MFLVSQRQKKLAINLYETIEELLKHVHKKSPIDLISFILNKALDYINLLFGDNVNSDEILDELFSRFCIGK